MLDYAALNERLRQMEAKIEKLEHLELAFYSLGVGTGTASPPVFGNLYVMNDAFIGRSLDVNSTGTFGTIVSEGDIHVIGNASQITFRGDNWGITSGSAGIQYIDSSLTNRLVLMFPDVDIVRLGNRAANGVVQIAANAAAGAGGEDIVSQFDVESDAEQNSQTIYGRTIQQAGATAATGNHGVIRQLFMKAVNDNSATALFAVKTNNGTNDAGHYHCFVDVIAMGNDGASGPDGTSAETATAHERFEWVRAQENGGTGVNSALSTEHGTPLDAATASATRDIGTITGSLAETSEFEIRFRVAVDGTGTSPTPLYCLAVVSLEWAGFEVAPYLDAV